MKRQVILGVSVAGLAVTLAAPAMADDDKRTIRQLLNTISQFDRGYGHFHHHRTYHDDDEAGRRREFHQRRLSRDDDD